MIRQAVIAQLAEHPTFNRTVGGRFPLAVFNVNIKVSVKVQLIAIDTDIRIDIDGRSSNGRTLDFESGNGGSIPSLPV